MSQKIWNVEELETLYVDIRPKTLHNPMTGGEECWKKKHWMIFLERMRKGHHQSNIRTVSGAVLGRQGWAHNYELFKMHRYHLYLNWTELEAFMMHVCVHMFMSASSFLFPTTQTWLVFQVVWTSRGSFWTLSRFDSKCWARTSAWLLKR